jgi:formylglycine-generating enzyme required for sulfatase activity
MKTMLIALTTLALLLTACGGSQQPGGAAQTTPKVTLEFKTPLPEADQAKMLPTNTPVPPPPTPTLRPTNTPLPPPTQEAAPSEATAQEPAAQATPAPVPPAVSEDMVEIPAGPFTMGNDQADPEDAPAHEVDVPAYEIDRFEVTNADFAAFAQATGYVTDPEKAGKKSWRDGFGADKANHPVTRVTWNDAAAYCEWLGKQLPTEAEWEKAARGTDGRAFPWGNDWDPSKADVKATGLRGTAAVGSFGAGASPYGIEDMAGNVWEWTADWYQAYPGNSTSDPYYGEQCRVTRGGGWFDEEAQATTFNRNCASPDTTANDDLGFRCARSK